MKITDPAKFSIYDAQAGNQFLSGDLVEVIAQRAAEIALGKKPNQDGKEYLTTREVAEIIPCSVSKVYHLVQGQRIPFQKVGRQLSFKRSEILDWKARGGASTPAPASKVRS